MFFHHYRFVNNDVGFLYFNLAQTHQKALDEMKSWSPQSSKGKNIKFIIYFVLNYSQSFPGKMSFVCNFIYFIFHLTPCNKYPEKKKKCLSSPSAEQISLSIAFLLRKGLIIMFQSDAAHCEICFPAISLKKCIPQENFCLAYS